MVNEVSSSEYEICPIRITVPAGVWNSSAKWYPSFNLALRSSSRLRNLSMSDLTVGALVTRTGCVRFILGRWLGMSKPFPSLVRQRSLASVFQYGGPGVEKSHMGWVYMIYGLQDTQLLTFRPHAPFD